MRHYRFIDVATQAYVLVVTAIVAIPVGRGEAGFGGLLAAHLLGAGLIHGLIQASAARPGRPVLEFLREFYPVLLFPAFYRTTASLNQVFHQGYFDPVFQQLDRQIFGFDPSLRFMAAFPQGWVSELFYAAYFSYYLMISGVGIALYVRRREAFRHYLSVVSVVFYVCYLIYIFLPVVGPRIHYPELSGLALPVGAGSAPEFPAAVQAGVFFRIMAVIYETFEAPGAAFPSSHVAAALVTVYFSFRYLRLIRWAHLVAVGLLSLATVYCRYHYAVDVAAGAVTAALLLPVGNWLHARGGGAGPERPDQSPRS